MDDGCWQMCNGKQGVVKGYSQGEAGWPWAWLKYHIQEAAYQQHDNTTLLWSAFVHYRILSCNEEQPMTN